MSLTILEVLQNARYNLIENVNSPVASLGEALGKLQLHNAVTLLLKGYDLHDDFDKIMGDHENAEEIPDANPSPLTKHT